MKAIPLLLTSLLLVSAPHADEARPDGCLSAAEQREAIAARKAVPLARAADAARARHNGEVINVRLCQHNAGLAYFLTIVDKQGKVMRAVVDASSAAVLQMR